MYVHVLQCKPNNKNYKDTEIPSPVNIYYTQSSARKVSKTICA